MVLGTGAGFASHALLIAFTIVFTLILYENDLRFEEVSQISPRNLVK